MNLLTVENISKSYGENVLFSNISFGINQGQKIALVAKNGTGKTSILNIISGKDATESGQVTQRKGIRVSFLEQEPNLNPNLTVEEIIYTSGNPILDIIETYNKALLNPDDQEAYQKAFDAMERNGAWDFETQYRQILFKLKQSTVQLQGQLFLLFRKKRCPH